MDYHLSLLVLKLQIKMELLFDNLSEGSYRVIEIVNRKYFEKPTYIQWNEVTINDELQEENIIVVNRVKRHSR